MFLIIARIRSSDFRGDICILSHGIFQIQEFYKNNLHIYWDLKNVPTANSLHNSLKLINRND